MPGKFYNEWQVGERIEHVLHRTVTETDNPQPLHLDAEEARKTDYGRILVNGTFTFALMVGLSVGDTTLGTLVANLGYDKVRHPGPVFIGDTLRAETEVTEVRPSNSRPGTGVVTFHHRMFNQHDDLVCECLRTALLKGNLA